MISYLADLDEGTGMANYATQLYQHVAELSDDIEQVPVHARSTGFAPRIVNEFIQVPRSYVRASGETVFLPTMNYGGLRYVPTRKRLVATVHDIIPLVTNHAPSISVKIMQRQAKVMQKADHLIAISEHTKRDLVEHLDIPEDDITVVYQGVDTDVFQPQEPSQETLEEYGIEPPYLLYVGTEKWRKNLTGTLKLFAKLRGRQPELSLVKVGPIGRQKYREQHMKTIRELGIEDDVVFTGFVDAADLPAIYSGAEGLLQLSHYEGLGRAPLEAMACGTLPIVADRTSLPEVVGDAGLLVDPEEPDIDTILTALQDPDQTALLDRAGQFRWEDTAQQTLEVLEDGR